MKCELFCAKKDVIMYNMNALGCVLADICQPAL